MKRLKRLQLLVSTEEHRLIKIECAERGISISNLVRMSINKFLNPDDKKLWKIKE